MEGGVDWGGVSWGDRVSWHGDVLGCMIWGWLSLHSVWTFIALIDIACMYWDPEGRASGGIECWCCERLVQAISALAHWGHPIKAGTIPQSGSGLWYGIGGCAAMMSGMGGLGRGEGVGSGMWGRGGLVGVGWGAWVSVEYDGMGGVGMGRRASCQGLGLVGGTP